MFVIVSCNEVIPDFKGQVPCIGLRQPFFLY